MSDEDRKIFIDEGWKAQVQREKELAAQAKSEPETPEGADSPAAAGEGEGELPEASFSAFLAGFVPQALFALGLMPEEGQQQVYVDLGQALYIIQMLEMLQEKTKGNLTEQESAELTQAVSELKRVFAMRAQQLEQQAMQQAGIDPNNLKGGGLQ